MKTITVETTVRASIEHVWACWTKPADIMVWNAASDDWACPAATNDLRIGGTFAFRMEAKDKSAGFDFGGTYTEIVPMARIAYTMDGEDTRKVEVSFIPTEGGVTVTETFEMENENPEEMQRAGWQAILERFRRHAESAH